MKSLNLFRVAVALVCVTVAAVFTDHVRAQHDEGAFILSMTEFTIKPGHNTQFQEGVKAWKTCYLENEGDWTWDIWRRVQGAGNVYVLTSLMENWAEMDEGQDDAARNCRDLARDLINPNVERSERNFARYMPAWSRATQDENPVVSVIFWRVKNTEKFRATVAEIHKAIRAKEGDVRGYWYNSIGGGSGNPNFLLVSTFKNFAAMDEARDNVWTVVENAFGKEKRSALQADFRDSIEDSWSYIFSKVEDLSHNP